jgi:glutamate synthase (NADPH/NADH) large chain
LAELGFRTLDEAIGRVDLLDTKDAVNHWKAAGLDLSKVLATPVSYSPDQPRRCTVPQDHGLEDALDRELIEICAPALATGEPVRAQLPVRNVNRAVGTLLGAEVTRKYGGAGLPNGTIDLTFVGSAGQSFAAFLPKGVTLRLEGDSNDYFAKGLSGGQVILRPDRSATLIASDNVIAGNVCLYGATSGEAFISGSVGERFAVRNSGAHAVVEGVGDHGCEYMTGGTVVVIGPTGRNFAAGMSGGIAFLLDCDETRINQEMVSLFGLSQEDETLVHRLLSRHQEETDSKQVEQLLANWPASARRFTKVLPNDYARVLAAQAQAEAEGADVTAAIMAASNG